MKFDIQQVVDTILEEQRSTFLSKEWIPSEEYLAKFPELKVSSEHAIDVIFHEFLLQNSLADLDRNIFLDRFPDYRDELEKQMLLCSGIDRAIGLTTDELEPHLNSHDQKVSNPILEHGSVFQVLDKIGQGASAVVFKAKDNQLNRYVALKIANHPVEPGSTAFQRFLREANSNAKLSHPAIVQVHEFGTDQGRPFIVSELMQGGTLVDRLDEKWTTVQIANWIARIAEAVHYAHQYGVVHRDIKPANILFDEHGEPRLGDFGLASLTESDSKLTQFGDLIGTPAYMSPEQAQGKNPLDSATDVYSLGVVLYQLICNKLPFTGGTASVLQKVISDSATPPREINSKIPRDLETICLKAMEKRVSDRYLSALAMSDDLKRFVNGEPIAARPASATDKLAKVLRKYPLASLLVGIILLLGSISFGGLLQYLNVVKQRDRAQTAEHKNELLLAIEAAQSGDLTMQRGQTRNAVEHFRSAIHRNHNDQNGLHLKTARCEIINGNLTSAQKHLEQVESKFEQDEFHLLMTQVMLGRGDSFDSATKLLDNIDSDRLKPEDREFYFGINADNSGVALNHFKRAIEFSPYHHASRRMSLILSLTLADFDYALKVAEVSEQMFPDDLDFRLVKALALAGADRLQDALGTLDDTDLAELPHKEWKALVRFFHKFCHSDEIVGNDRIIDDRELTRLIHSFASYHVPTIASRNWYMPPRISKRISEFIQEVEKNALTESGIGISQQTAMLPLVHPEGSLACIIARSLLETDIRKNKITTTTAEAARNLYLSAQGQNSFRKETPLEARYGAFVTSVYLVVILKSNVAENTAKALAYMEAIDPAEIVATKELRTMSVFAIQNKAWDIADRYSQEWLSDVREQKDPTALEDALWHRAVTFEGMLNWQQVLVCCDAMMRLHDNGENWPRRKVVSDLRMHASVQLVEQVEQSEVEIPWSSMIESALVNEDQNLLHLAITRFNPDQIKNKEAVVGTILEISKATSNKNWSVAQRLIQQFRKEFPDSSVGKLDRLFEKCQNSINGQ